ncbi:MAG: glycosyltransferase [Acidobacteria bacterium]|nr:glycosyltransferase [Acidobacteriota bacterium]MBV9478294.1 glycosyltransferase [Acidobacteriota bacterium]
MKRIRLLWLIDSLTVGGAESLIVPFARQLDPSRYELFLCCLATIQGNALEKELRAANIEVLNLGARNLRDLRAFRKLLRFLREQRIDLIHAHLTYASIWAAVASRLTKIPSVATLHVAPPADGRFAIRDRLMRFVTNRWSSRVIAVSDALRRRYLERGGLAPSRIITVHNGIEVDRFARDARESRALLARDLDIPDSARIVATVSVLRPGKGIEVLLDAIPHVVAQVPDACFVIVGDGPMRAAWTAQANALGVERHIRWAGYRNDVAALLAGCELFVLPSLDDAFPTVLMEALAAGVPIVATNVGGIPEIVDANVGRLVPANDADALARAIATLLADRATHARMRGATRPTAGQRFSTRVWIDRLDAVYQEAAR